MIRWLLLLVLVGLGIALAVLLRRLWREARALRRGRAACLDTALPLLAAPRVVLDPAGFPRIAGRVGGRRIEVRAMPDALTFRKLPALWLLATLTEPQPLRGECRIVVRPSGFEPFSTFAALPAEAALPAGFPAEAVLRAEDPGLLPPASFLAGLAPLFADVRLKEVVLSPNGIRLVRLVDEAPRGRYLLFREADLGRAPVPEAALRASLGTLLALARQLAEASEPPVARRA
ncbi:MAG: hypothetical protein QM699_07095 [Amaricoccus sp.]|uniref:hypothetical protein n=1 Tax=Amaricoccus sp. TaxID=1872485 RepID=UPI0039E5F00A